MFTFKDNRVELSDYVKSFNFEYLETYSMQRGGNYVVLSNLLQQIKERAKNGVMPTKEESQQLKVLYELIDYDAVIYNYNTQKLYHDAVKTGTFARQTSEAEELLSICAIAFTESYDWMCAPVYRDAVIFYNANHQIVSTLNICLSCESIWPGTGDTLKVDFKTYQQLRNFFRSLGHYIEK